MLLINSKTLPANAKKDHELYPFVEEYTNGVNQLKLDHPTLSIRLKRNGYPKVNKAPDGSSALPEIPAPIMFKLTKTDKSGAIWGYCKGRPKIQPNGLVEVPEGENSETFSNEIETLDLKGKPDFTFFVMYKSGLVGTEFSIFDPEGDKMKELREKNSRMAVTNAIWSNMDDNKVRLMASAYDIDKAGEKDILILKEELETKVFKMEEFKRKNPTNLMLKGIEAFLADARNDEYTRPKALIKLGIEDKRITYEKNHFYFDGNDLCHVPFGRDDDFSRREYLAQFFRDPQNNEKWLMVVKGLLSKDYIEKMDKYGIRYFAGQLDIPLNQKEPDLKDALLAQFE